MLIKGSVFSYEYLADKDKFVYIYKILNPKTGKMYIGKTKNLKNRINDHAKTPRQISDLGKPKNWTIEILEVLPILESLTINERDKLGLDIEKIFIKEHVLKHKSLVVNRTIKWR